MISKYKDRGWEGLDPFAKALFKETYFLPNEDYEGWVQRISTAYANDPAHASRLATYLHNYWAVPSTPISSNGGTDRGLPIACYVGTVGDSKEHIFDAWRDSMELGSKGGGEGKDWSPVREIHAKVGKFGGTSSGIIPFNAVDGKLADAISQGGIRRFSSASYLHISHPEIEEFIDIRKPTGDQQRRAQSLHHAVTIPDSFMQAVITNGTWELVSPYDGKVVKTVDARRLWEQLLEVRATLKGEPYLLFIDNVNRHNPKEYTLDGLSVTTSQLCNEITLATSPDRGNVCCLTSVNAEYYDEWKTIPEFIGDWADFLDNVLTDFLKKTEGNTNLERFRKGAIDERAIGLGVMGFHSLLQKRNIPFESAIAKGLNIELFKYIAETSDMHQLAIGQPCPLAVRTGSVRRNVHQTAVAPTMSISTLANVTSSGIEPWLTNAFTKKVKQGAFPIRNKYLKQLIINQEKSTEWVETQWKSIVANNGSVQQLDWMTDWDKDVFKTAFEIDQNWVILHASDRVQYITQGQSLNLFIPGGSNVQLISDLHMSAWGKGLKGLYYLRSTAVDMASTEANSRKKIDVAATTAQTIDEMNQDTCLGCS